MSSQDRLGIELPQPCYFCEEDILMRGGVDGRSLVVHSLDGNHDNWESANKVPTHKGCHIAYHRGKDSVKVTSDTSMSLPYSIRDKLVGRKKYDREPLWKVIERLLEVKEE